MNMKSIIKRCIRKIRKILKPKPHIISPEEIRREQAIVMGKQLKLSEHDFIFHCTNLKPRFYIPLYQTDYIQQRILTEETYYEHDSLNFICKEWKDGIVQHSIQNGCILDIGANIGNHTLYFFFECGIAHAYCFEPVPTTYDILQRNISLNNLTNKTTLINAAVGAQEGVATISHYDETNIGSTQIAITQSGSIPVRSIDSMDIQEHINLIKVDVEGFEVGVVEGCIKTIERNKPYIMIEIQEENFNRIIELLSPFSYKYHQLNVVNYLFYIE